MFELIFFSSHLPALYFFPFNYRLFSTLISNVVKKKKKKHNNHIFVSMSKTHKTNLAHIIFFFLIQGDFFSEFHKGQSITIRC